MEIHWRSIKNIKNLLAHLRRASHKVWAAEKRADVLHTIPLFFVLHVQLTFSSFLCIQWWGPHLRYAWFLNNCCSQESGSKASCFWVFSVGVILRLASRIPKLTFNVRYTSQSWPIRRDFVLKSLRLSQNDCFSKAYLIYWAQAIVNCLRVSCWISGRVRMAWVMSQQLLLYIRLAQCTC